MLIGIDCESISRINKIITHASFAEDSIMSSVFSFQERKNGLSKKYPAKYFALRYAGKEALLKALGTGFRSNLCLSDIEFLNDSLGAPTINCYASIKTELLKRDIRKVCVSFSHSEDSAMAVLILEE